MSCHRSSRKTPARATGDVEALGNSKPGDSITLSFQAKP
jgi:hypothetical protein